MAFKRWFSCRRFSQWRATWSTFLGATYDYAKLSFIIQIIYEFLAACFYYAFIAASIAELASSIPSSGGGTSSVPKKTPLLNLAR
jgi:amino acid transporter